jgi:hypothetical protein
VAPRRRWIAPLAAAEGSTRPHEGVRAPGGARLVSPLLSVTVAAPAANRAGIAHQMPEGSCTLAVRKGMPVGRSPAPPAHHSSRHAPDGDPASAWTPTRAAKKRGPAIVRPARQSQSFRFKSLDVEMVLAWDNVDVASSRSAAGPSWMTGGGALGPPGRPPLAPTHEQFAIDRRLRAFRPRWYSGLVVKCHVPRARGPTRPTIAH